MRLATSGNVRFLETCGGIKNSLPVKEDRKSSAHGQIDASDPRRLPIASQNPGHKPKLASWRVKVADALKRPIVYENGEP
jgi:hypothetical protein